MFSVQKISERQELLTRTIGARPEETESFNNSVTLFNWVIVIFLLFSLLELLFFLAYEYLVSKNEILKNRDHKRKYFSFILGRKS